MQAHIVFGIHTLTQCTLSMHSAVAGWFDNLSDAWTNSSGAEYLSSSSDDELPGLINVTSLHSHFFTNEQFFAFLDGSPIPITVDSDVSPIFFVADPPCTSLSSALLPTIEGPPTVPFSWNNSLPAPFSVQDISDAYHHVHIDVDSPLPDSPPPYDSALWDPAYSSDDEMPPLTDGSSTDGYDSSSSDESIPAHARYDVDSEIDDCRLGDQPSPESEDELWNAEFWSTPNQGAYLLSPAAWASWQLANSVENGNDHDNYQDAHDHPEEVESDDDEFYGVAPPEDSFVTASSAASTICRILASGRHQECPT
jgi:hypothetical protein